jgi:hypothetical protein
MRKFEQQRYNLSSYIFDEAAIDDVDIAFAVYGYDANPAPANAGPPYAAEDIIIVCTLLVSLLQTF